MIRRTGIVVAFAWLASFMAMPAAQALDHGQDAAHGTVLAKGTSYVSIVRLTGQSDPKANGRLLMVFERAGMQGVPLYQSRDGGRHWTFRSYVTDQAHAGNPRWQLRWQPNITEVHRRSGDLTPGTLLLAANATLNDSKGRVIAEDLQLYASRDGGHTWHYRGSIVKGGGRPEDKDNKGVWESNIHILDDGRMVAYYSSEQHKAEGYNQVLAHKVSEDGGRHWGTETVDVAIPGGVQRPGMATVTRLPDGRYAMTYENIDGPRNGQVFIKFSRDGLHWGSPDWHGEPVMTAAGAWPAACPVVQWFPLDGPEGVIVVSAERAGGGGDENGHSLYWNNALGRGPWWEVPAPVQKRTGNIHAGWTQALMLRKDGKLLHVTSSSSAADSASPAHNRILHAAARLHFNRYEAEDAARTSAAMIVDNAVSNGRKVRLGAGSGARLRFRIHVAEQGGQVVRVRFMDLDPPGIPNLDVNGARLPPAHVVPGENGWQVATWHVSLLTGFNTIDVGGGQHVLDVDYLQLDSE